MVPPEMQPEPGDMAIIMHGRSYPEWEGREVYCTAIYSGPILTRSNRTKFKDSMMMVEAEWLPPTSAKGWCFARETLLRITPPADMTDETETEQERRVSA